MQVAVALPNPLLDDGVEVLSQAAEVGLVRSSVDALEVLGWCVLDRFEELAVGRVSDAGGGLVDDGTVLVEPPALLEEHLLEGLQPLGQVAGGHRGRRLFDLQGGGEPVRKVAELAASGSVP